MIRFRLNTHSEQARLTVRYPLVYRMISRHLKNTFAEAPDVRM